MQLQDIYDYKNQLIKDLLTHESIVKLINDDVTVEDAYERLMYKQVFPYEYIPDTAQYGFTYVCSEVDITRVYNKTYLAPVLYIWVLSHRSRLRLPEGGIRSDKLCSEICKVINGSRYYGLGQLILYSSKRFTPMTDYNGKLLTFQMREFNFVHDGKQSIPENRKNYDNDEPDQFTV